MDNVNERFIDCIADKNLNGAASLLQTGADIHYDDDCALRHSVVICNWNVVLKLLEWEQMSMQALIMSYDGVPVIVI